MQAQRERRDYPEDENTKKNNAAAAGLFHWLHGLGGGKGIAACRCNYCGVAPAVKLPMERSPCWGISTRLEPEATTVLPARVPVTITVPRI